MAQLVPLEKYLYLTFPELPANTAQSSGFSLLWKAVATVANVHAKAMIGLMLMIGTW